MTHPQPSFSVRLFGSPRIERPDGTVLTGRAVQRHRVGMIALLAAAHPRGRAREAVIAMLWPEHDMAGGRRLLNQTVYILRKTFGQNAVRSEMDELRLEVGCVPVDVVAFRQAIARGDDARAAGLYSGSFLDGFFVPDASEFNDWADRERATLARMYANVLERLARAAELAGDGAAAAEWWAARVAHDPASSGATLRLMLALEAIGDRGGALRMARLHEELLREEFDAEAAPEIGELADRLRGAQPLPAPASTSPKTTDGGIDALVTSTRAVTRARAGATVAARDGGVRLLVRAAAVVGLVSLFVALLLTEWQSGSGASRGTHSIAAYELYQRGTDGALLRSDSGVHAGIEHLKRAVELDPLYAAAWAGLGKLYGRASASAPRSERENYFALGMQAAARALALDDSLADAHAVYGILLMRAFDFQSAEQHLQRALELNPEEADTHEWLVTLYLWVGRPSEALAHAERALELNPLSPRANAELARALAGNDRCPEALERLKRLESVEPPLLRVSSIAAMCHARLQEWDAAIASLQRAPADAGQSNMSLMGFILALAGRTEEALHARDEIFVRWQRGEADAFDVALQFVGANEIDEAYVWLNRAVEDRSLNGLPAGPAHGQVVGPLFANVQSDPRFVDLTRRYGAVPVHTH